MEIRKVPSCMKVVRWVGGGGKLVIRTELLFEAQGFGQFKPPTNDNVTAQS